MLLHLALDTLGTAAGVMWLYPVITSGFALGTHISLASLIIIKIILLIIPVIYILYNFKRTGDNPLDLLKYIENKLGTKATYALFIIFTILVVYIGITEYLMKLM
jgi:hypothetical protein